MESFVDMPTHRLTSWSDLVETEVVSVVSVVPDCFSAQLHC